MKTILSIAALLAVSLVSAQESQAKGPSNSGSHVRFYSSQHRNFSSYCWNARYGCYYYGCPTTSCSYYWYAPSCCYYPVSYIAQYPPTPVAYQPVSPGTIPLPTQVNVPIQVTNVNTNTLANNSPGIPVTPGFIPKGP
jgi:hypothetical protein